MERVSELITLPSGYTIYLERYACQARSAQGVVLLVNGALATMASFRQTTRYLRERFDVVLYDLPFAGRSAAHNQLDVHLAMADEALILRELIASIRPDYLVSVSWGGAASLQALAAGRTSVRRAVIASFAPELNALMRFLVSEWIALYECGSYEQAIHSFHKTLGAFLPERIQRRNIQYMLQRREFEHRQTLHQLREVFTMDPDNVRVQWCAIPVPVLFLNGRHDLFTTASDARGFERHVPDAHFVVIDDVGHFLDLESLRGRQEVRDAILGFIQTEGSATPSPDVQTVVPAFT